MNCKVVLLHNELSLLEDCCKLLNKEWKRSYGVRSRFLTQSNDGFPCSLVLLINGSVSGHVRLSNIIGEEKSLFLTSVIIDPSLRGNGFGKKLMAFTEEYALSRGYNSLCLSSDECEKFYEKCGYILCQPVQQCQSKALNNTLCILHKKTLEQKKTEINKMHAHAQSTFLNDSLEQLASVYSSPEGLLPPPPPPPPPTVASSQNVSFSQMNTNDVLSKVWMRKKLR